MEKAGSGFEEPVVDNCGRIRFLLRLQKYRRIFFRFSSKNDSPQIHLPSVNEGLANNNQRRKSGRTPMSQKQFIMYLQKLLNMVNGDDLGSISLGRAVLSAQLSLAYSSGKIDASALETMRRADACFHSLAIHAAEYAEIPGQHAENRIKREQLLRLLAPDC